MFPVYTLVWCPIISLSSHFPLYLLLHGTYSHRTLFIHSAVCSLSHFLSPLWMQAVYHLLLGWPKFIWLVLTKPNEIFWPTQYILSAKFLKSFSWINQLSLLIMLNLYTVTFSEKQRNVLIKGQCSVVEKDADCGRPRFLVLVPPLTWRHLIQSLNFHGCLLRRNNRESGNAAWD